MRRPCRYTPSSSPATSSWPSASARTGASTVVASSARRREGAGSGAGSHRVRHGPAQGSRSPALLLPSSGMLAAPAEPCDRPRRGRPAPAVSSAPPSAPANSACLASCTASTRPSMLSRTSRRVTTTGLRRAGWRGEAGGVARGVRVPSTLSLACGCTWQAAAAVHSPGGQATPQASGSPPPARPCPASPGRTAAGRCGARAPPPAARWTGPARAPAGTRCWRAPG